jgi:hypothetical protein
MTRTCIVFHPLRGSRGHGVIDFGKYAAIGPWNQPPAKAFAAPPKTMAGGG